MDLLIFLLMVLYLVGAGDSSDYDGVAAGLMAFKRSSVVSDPNGFLSTWSSSSTNTNPCSSWRGVICSSLNNNDKSGGVVVIGLNLTNAGLIGHDFRLDLLLISSLPNLTQLHLSGNYFSGDLFFHAHSLPCNLETIDLSSNNFSVPISDAILVSCQRLTSLNLSRNYIPRFGSSSSSGLGSSSSSLREFDLSHNLISDNFIFNYTLTNCQSLNFLNLSDNKLSSRFPPSISSSCKISLSVLDLSHNNLSWELSSSSIHLGDCRNLTHLDLSHNSLSGIGFPPELSNFTLLRTLDLSHNSLSSNISPWVLGSLTSLQHLSLAHNHFTGDIPTDIARACGSLRYLDLSENMLTGGLPSTFKSCSSLQSLNLGNNQLSGDFLDTVVSTITSLRYLYAPFNNITGSIPTSLLINCTQLQVLDLSSNNFTGPVPSIFCSTSFSSSLEKILLPNNLLWGDVPSELGNCKNLKTLDLSFNNLRGSIPTQVWELPNLSDLVMWANNISGEIPSTICKNGGNLETLILNNNFITGTIPESLSTCTNLIWVSLSGNMIRGEIPRGVGNLKKLAILQLGNNTLTGEIPPELGKCESLIWLDLNSNSLTGTIPPELAAQAGLVTPGLVSGKQFAFVRNEGGTSCRGAGGLAEFEGIRKDRFERLPTLLRSCTSIRIYTGLTVYSFNNNGSMIYLDLSYNNLSGGIPDDLGSMSYLQVLNLGHNALTGTIPDTFGGLKQVGVLDLSHNDLQGFLPGSLGTLSFLTDLDVSNNNLTGPIPSAGQLTTFPPSRYENNSGLCGVPLPTCGSYSSGGGGAGHYNSGGNKKRSSMASGVIIGIMVALFIIIGLILALCRMRISQRKEDQRDKYIESLPTSGSSSWKLSGVLEPLSINIATFEKPLRKLTFGHLLEATNGFSPDSLIGSGGFGDVYKAQLRDGCTVAIKKLIHVTGQGEREFTAEMETIGKIKHRNLVPLLGYCRIGEERLLVYEYMKWGSLETVLHERNKDDGGVASKGGSMWNSKLDWAARKKIAIGAARGLAFLHHSCIPHIIHRDMKSSNVLLDENLDARVSDFGMARLMNALDTHLSVSTLAGTPGYVPPEYYQSFRCTTKGDVYSYGVILLELLSGKKPIDPSVFGDDNNLVGWAKQLQREKRSSEILEPELLLMSTSTSHEDQSPVVVEENELHQYLKIAFECLDDRPFRRPTMIQVMAMFKELQMDSESDILDGFSLKETVLIEESEKN